MSSSAKAPVFTDTLRTRLNSDQLVLIRLILMVAVLLIHFVELSPQEFLKPWLVILDPIAPVRCFFIMTGFLVALSFLKSKSIADFARRRWNRLFPTYIFVVGISAILLTQNFGLEFWQYLVANLATMNFLAPTLPGVFEENPQPWVNGALWTLKVDLMLYACVPAIVWAVERWGPEKTLGLIYALSASYEVVFRSLINDWPLAYQLSVQAPAQLASFVAGTYLLYRFDWFDRNVRWLFPAALAVYAVAWPLGISPVLPASLAIILLTVCLYFPLKLPRMKNDYSYALCLVHFPIIQVLIANGAAAWPPALYLLAALALPGLAAFLIWHLFEKHFVGRHLPLPALTWPPSRRQPAGRR